MSDVPEDPPGRPPPPVPRPPTEIPDHDPLTVADDERARLDWHHPEFRGQRRPSSRTHGGSPSSRSSGSSNRSGSRSGSRGSSRSTGWGSRPGGGSDRRRRRHHWYRPRNTVLIPLLVVLLVVGGFVLYLDAQLSGIRRAPFLPTFDTAGGRGVNVLLVGSEAPSASLRVDTRTMVVQLVHLSVGGTAATVVHVPRDLLLDAPARAGSARTGRARHGRHAAAAPVRRTLVQTYRRAGDPGLVEAVRAAFGVRIDHVVQVGFGAYVDVTDRLGGVDLPTAQGVRHFSGLQALGYADATTGLTLGTVDTGHRHQQWLKAMLTGVLDPTVLLNPLTVVGLLHDTTPHLVLDETLTNGEIRHLLWTSRQLRPGTIRYLTAPYTRYARVHGRRVLLPDRSALGQLGDALRRDDNAGLGTFQG